MAIAGPTTQSDPELTYRDPNAYIAFLRSQRIPPQQIYQMVTDRFGAPKSPQEQAKDQAAAQQRAGLAQTGGTLAGMLGTGYLASQLGGGASVATPALLSATKVGAGTVATPTLVGATKVGAGAGASGGTPLGAVGSAALPVAVTALALNNIWESGMKDIVRGRADRADWTNQAINMNPYTAPINMGLRLFGKRSLGKMMTTGKSDDQLMRDDFRGLLKETGVANKNYEVSLADGTKFNIGLDGKTRYQNVGENIDGKTQRQAWDVDFSNPLAKYATDQIDPMIRSIYAETDGKVKPEQYTGILVNAVTSNAKSEQDVLNNIQSVIGKSNFAKQAGVAVPTSKQPITKAPKGQVVRVSPGMYVNDQGKVGPAKTMRQALKANLKGK